MHGIRARNEKMKRLLQDISLCPLFGMDAGHCEREECAKARK